jgi:hypothetical protein
MIVPRHHDIDESACHHAELSRPHRAFKRDQHRYNKPQGRKRTHNTVKAKRMNWFTPFVWSQIVNAAKKSGTQMGAVDIKRYLNIQNPQTFKALNVRTIRKWIDRSGTIPRWNDTVLKRISKGNQPGGENTRQGILVCNPSQHITIPVE